MITQTFIRRVRTSVVQGIRTYVVQRKQTLKRTGVGLAVLGLLFFGASATFILTQEGALYTSELAFIERSENSGVEGTVIPASCESDIVQNHFAGDCQCSIVASACQAYSPGYCLKTISAAATFGPVYWTAFFTYVAYGSYGTFLGSSVHGSFGQMPGNPTPSLSVNAWIPLSGANFFIWRGYDYATVCSANIYGEAPPVPSAPTWIGPTCSPQGNWTTLNWGGATGYIEYYALRVNDASTGWDGSCTGGGDFCTNVGGTAFGYGTNPSHAYSTWVHACNSTGCSPGYAWTSFDCPAEPTGNFDAINCTSGSGWSCDADSYATPLSIHFYDGSTFIGSTIANQTRADVGPSCGGYTAHGFTFNTPWNVKTGTNKSITAYAINTMPAGNNPSLGSLGLICPTPLCVGPRPANTTIYPNDNIDFLSDTLQTYSAGNTAAKCEYACNYGYVWNGATCDPIDIYATSLSPVANFIQKIGSPITFSGNAINGNVLSVSQGGWAGVEVDWGDDGGASAVYYDANGGVQLGSFTPGQSKALSYTENSAPAGIHMYRFNVDSTNVLAESDESNNESSWTSFRVISGDLTVSNAPAHGPGTITLDWSTQGTMGLNNCIVQGGSNSWPGPSGNVPVSLTNHGTYTYTLTCGGIELDKETVTIDLSPDLSVDKRVVEQSTNVNLSWKLYTQTGCTLTGGGLNMTLPNSTLPGDNSQLVPVDGRTTYTLTCPIGSDSVMVEVVPKGYES